MQEIAPPIWRTVRVPAEFSLHRLHRVLQIVFSRLDCHLYEFQLGTRRFQAPDPEAEEAYEDSTVTTLGELGLRPGSRFAYTYDFGDDWAHEVVVEQELPIPDEGSPDRSPRLLDGERAAPPEDAGGSLGYERMIQALRNPSDPEHDSYRDWAGPTYDPDRFDPWAIDHALALAAAWGAI